MVVPVVLDCSILAAVSLPDESTERIRKIFGEVLASGALCPELLKFEFTNVLKNCINRERLTVGEALEIYKEVVQLPIVFADARWPDGQIRVLTLAEQQRLSAYDATYLELALSEKIPLATMDKALANAAKNCGVEVIN